MSLWVRVCGAVSLSVVMSIGALSSTPVHADAPRRVAHGLIVKLREGALLQTPQRLGDNGDRQRRERLRKVVNDAGIGNTTAMRMRPVGSDAQHLDFGRMLEPDEAEHLIAKLRARADVEWVVPNTLERRMAVPNDCLYPTPVRCGVGAGQWWMYPAGGSSANALADRLRGVPGFESAWDLQTGLPSAPVAVLDTGITSHPDLAPGRILAGYDFVTNPIRANDSDGGRDPDPTDPGDWVSQQDKQDHPNALPRDCRIEESSWHGTNTAGMIAATTNNGLGLAGINWNSRIVPVRVAGKCGAAVADIIDAMQWAAGLEVCIAHASDGSCAARGTNPNPVRIISLSFGGTGADRFDCTPYQATINQLVASGVVIVAAGGNEQGAVPRPARCPGVVGVGAVNRDGFKANYSNFGPELAITTIGGDPRFKRDRVTCDGIWGCLLGDGGVLGLDNRGEEGPGEPIYSDLAGTSFSTPVVAGAVSLMLSANPALTYRQIVDGLQLSVRPHVTSTRMPTCSTTNYGRCICTTATCGAGLLDAAEAVRYARDLSMGQVFTPRNWPTENIDSPEIEAAVALGPDEPDVNGEANGVEGGVDGSSGSGGGALQPAWLLALALLTLLLAFAPRSRHAVRRARR